MAPLRPHPPSKLVLIDTTYSYVLKYRRKVPTRYRRVHQTCSLAGRSRLPTRGELPELGGAGRSGGEFLGGHGASDESSPLLWKATGADGHGTGARNGGCAATCGRGHGVLGRGPPAATVPALWRRADRGRLDSDRYPRLPYRGANEGRGSGKRKAAEGDENDLYSTEIAMEQQRREDEAGSARCSA